MPIVGHLAENGLVVYDEFRQGNVVPLNILPKRQWISPGLISRLRPWMTRRPALPLILSVKPCYQLKGRFFNAYIFFYC